MNTLNNPYRQKRTFIHAGFLLLLLPITDLWAQRPLLAPRILEETRLEIVWQRPMPLKDGERIEQFVRHDDRLYILTDTNYLLSLRADNGKTIFMRSVAPAGFVVQGWHLEEENLVAAIGNHVTYLAPNTGTTRGYKDYGLSIVSPPVATDTDLYLAADDRRVHAIDRDSQVRHYRVGTFSDAPVTTVHADDERVLIGSGQGDICALNPRKRAVRQWHFEADDRIVGPLVVEDDMLYFASRDSYVYKLHLSARQGQLVWRYASSALLDSAPTAGASVLYQREGFLGLSAIDKENGTAQWFLPGGRQFLAESARHAYVWTDDRHLVLIDHDSGALWRRVPIANIAYACTNTADASIFLADDHGSVVCLTPETQD